MVPVNPATVPAEVGEPVRGGGCPLLARGRRGRGGRPPAVPHHVGQVGRGRQRQRGAEPVLQETPLRRSHGTAAMGTCD